MTSAVVTALKTLTRPVSEVSVCDSASPQDALLVALRSNRAALLQQLQSDPGLEEVRKWREEIMEGAAWFLSPTTKEGGEEEEDTTWCFVQECLLLLLVLARHLTAELERFEQTPAVSNNGRAAAAPPLPPDVLSVAQQRTLGAALQFVVSLGLCPYLSPGVGVSLRSRSAFGAMVEKLIRGGSASRAAEQRLHTTTSVLLQVSQLSSLATTIFTQHLGDLMAALCQLGYRPRGRNPEQQQRQEQKDLSPEDRKSCQDALRNLLGRVHQPIVIKELLILQGGARQSSGSNGSAALGSAALGSAALGSAPAWLRRLCGRLLSERLVQPSGVQAVVRAILEGGTGGDSDWRKCDSVARILVTCPQQSASAEEYYRHVCPQILDLLHFKDKLTAQQFQRVATRAVLFMVEEKSTFAQQHLLAPLLEPLHRCRTMIDGGAAVEEWELTRCVEDVFKIWVVGDGSSAALLSALEDVLPVVFTLFCFSRQNVSHLRAPCQDTLLWYLSHCDEAAALSALRQLSGLGGPRSEADAHFHFTPGSDGGARFSTRDRVSEDDALYQDISEEQWRLECLMALLSELKDSDLPGDFFLLLLQELTSWTTADGEDTEEEQELDLSSMTLLQVEQQVLGPVQRKGQKVALLQVLAVMVESVQHSVLLRKATQVVDFIVSLFQRACVSLDQDSDLENPVESQTLSMGIGLVATLLSGPQLSPEEFSSMSRLLPPLETLSQNHPDDVIQELASNLRAVIATRGAFRPENITGPASTELCGNRTDRVKKQKVEPETRTCPADPLSRRTRTRQEEPGPGPGPGPGPAATRTPANTSTPPPSNKPFSDWLLEACDPDVPTRALALRVLTKMVQKKNPDTIKDQEKVLMVFLENLQHQDSFVYLSAIQGLVSLADVFPEKILDQLLRDFKHGPSHPSSNQEHSLETRLKVGEVLMRASRAMGDLASYLGRPLVRVFLQGTRDVDPGVRASSLSNLGELCQRLDYSLGPLVQEVSVCLVSLIKTEKESEVRRAAVHVITLLLRGLSHRTTEVLSDVLLDLYRALKWTLACDPDQVAVLHAQLALEELDDVMRSFIFPQQKLEKKIVVLP
ncbi:transport and Golgi organization protein 6 homolog [Cynoglossus semilaevis]|uniref:Transport and golgi organization 6 homolog n=1 Tax=Cynoglossus semilaevis TaxID=244447 RepID=A0A3P8UDU3_CYNSE|nr:transport and Golgi organization protein 6 homolog [Cynoglossus semilaevis]